MMSLFRILPFLLGAVVIASAADTLKLPNIVFILADDLGYGDVGFNGQKYSRTPHLDRLAREGANMTSFYAGAPVCGPSRASLMFGQHTGHSSIRRNPAWTLSGKVPELKPDDIILPKELKRAGYVTGVFGKWGLNDNLKSNIGHPLKQGFDEFYGFNTHGEAHWHWPNFVWDGEEKVWLGRGEGSGANWKRKFDYADDLFQERALDFIQRKSQEDQPFFAYVNYTIPHKGFSVPASSREPYEQLGWPRVSKDRDYYRNDPDILTAFAGMISHMDAYVGEIRSMLEDMGVADNTLIFFTSDNGHEMKNDFFDSNGIYRGKKRDLYEGGIRMPTVVYWPGRIGAETVIEAPFAIWDVLPTFCEIVGIEPRGAVDGVSFLPSLLGEAGQQHHEFLYWEFGEHNGPMQAVRFGDWKALRFWDKEAMSFKSPELYNLADDPGERKDLSERYPEIVKRAMNYIDGARTEHPEYPLTLIQKSSGKKK